MHTSYTRHSESCVKSLELTKNLPVVSCYGKSADLTICFLVGTFIPDHKSGYRRHVHGIIPAYNCWGGCTIPWCVLHPWFGLAKQWALQPGRFYQYFLQWAVCFYTYRWVSIMISVPFQPQRSISWIGNLWMVLVRGWHKTITFSLIFLLSSLPSCFFLIFLFVLLLVSIFPFLSSSIFSFCSFFNVLMCIQCLKGLLSTWSSSHKSQNSFIL